MPSTEFDPRPWGQPSRVTAIDCALMELRTKVHRNILKVRQMPSLCQAATMVNSPLVHDLIWKNRDTVIGNELYCTEWNSEYDVPLKLLADNGAYMWLD